MNDFKMQFTSKLFFYPNRGLINGVLILGLVRSSDVNPVSGHKKVIVITVISVV